MKFSNPTSSTVNCKSFYVCDKDNFNLFCAAAMAGLLAGRDSLPEDKWVATNAADYAEAMMEEFARRRMAK